MGGKKTNKQNKGTLIYPSTLSESARRKMTDYQQRGVTTINTDLLYGPGTLSGHA